MIKDVNVSTNSWEEPSLNIDYLSTPRMSLTPHESNEVPAKKADETMVHIFIRIGRFLLL
jgi:hypothetical protein